MDPVVLRPKPRSLFVGSFGDLGIEIDPGSGLSLDDLRFEVPSGLAGGLVSPARGPGFTPQTPTLLLLAGFEPGTHVVQAIEGASNTVVGEAKFRVFGTWRGRRGPRLWFSGSPGAQLAGSAWGGGPAGPQNVATVPATGTRRLAVLFVDTSSQRFTTNATTMQGHRDRWLNEIVNGVTIGGQVRSVRQFYREMALSTITPSPNGANFDISAQVFGPVSLTGNFDSYFNADGTPKGSYFQACITAGDSVIDYTQFDSLVCVSQSVSTTRFAWPYASIGRWGPYTTADGNVNIGVISMPNDWDTLDGREIHETLSHELGHNLGLGDQYTPTVAGRNPGAWDLMHADDPLPYVSAAHRMMLGWLPAGWVRTFNFAAGGAPVDQSVALHPIEQGPPAAGRVSVAEVRIGDGLNYYFEYRNGENPQIGDRALPTDDRVLGTDVASAPFVPPFSRPAVLLLPSSGDDNGAVLGNGEFYREIDASPAPVEFRADVSGITGSKADLRIRYGTNGRPDPSIRPWPAAPDRPWQSPDIEVRNAKSMADPSWRNVPWVGNPNTIVATVRNGGNVLAPSVQVDFYVKNFNIGGAPEVWLASQSQDIPAGATREFTASWVPPSTGHYCVIVRIPLYVVPTAPTVVEMTELNNVAQSNYDRFNTATSSPSTREVTYVQVGNPYDEATRVWVLAEQTNPLYRTYLGTTWLWLRPRETRRIRVMFEYSLDPKTGRIPPDVEKHPEAGDERLRFRPNDVGLFTYAENPHDRPRHALELLGGAQVQVTTGRSTEIERLSNDGTVVVGRVLTSDDQAAVSGGRVVVTVAVDRGDPRTFVSEAGDVQDGRFFVRVPTEDWEAIKADYLGTTGFSPCDHDWIPRR